MISTKDKARYVRCQTCGNRGESRQAPLQFLIHDWNRMILEGEAAELKPCYKCGEHAKVVHSDELNTAKWRVECQGCLNPGLAGITPASAARFWNNASGHRMDKEDRIRMVMGVDPGIGSDYTAAVVGTVTGRAKLGPNANGDIFMFTPEFTGKMVSMPKEELDAIAEAVKRTYNGISMGCHVQSQPASYPHPMSPEELKVYEYILGVNGKPRMKLIDIAKQLNFSPAKVSRLKKSIEQKLSVMIAAE